jgi:uncharacterized protein (DUF1697 family)
VTVYAAFIRGINLGPTNKIAMARLRELAEGLGWQQVASYINSGNLVFRSGEQPAALARALGGALGAELGRTSVDVAVRSRAELAEVLAAVPWPDGHPSKVNVAFLMAPLPPEVVGALREVATDREPFVVRETEIFVNYQDGLGRSRLAEKFASVVRVSATTRTIGTVTKVLALCDRTAEQAGDRTG